MAGSEKLDRSLYLLLVFTFFMVVGFEMIMPLVVGQFVGVRGFRAASVASALAVRRFIQQGCAPLTGFLADRVSIRLMICVGVLFRAVGFLVLSNDSSYVGLLAAMVMIGTGGVLFDVPFQTTIGQLTSVGNRSRYYSLYHTVSGIGSTLGPMLGALLLRWNFMSVCAGAALCFLLNFFVALISLPPVRREEAGRSAGGSITSVLNNHRFIMFLVVMVIFWLAAIQIDISYPLKIQKLTGEKTSISVMYTLYAVVTMLFQYPLITFLSTRLSKMKTILAGVIFIAASSLLAGYASSAPVFYGAVVLFTFGMILARPSQQAVAVELASEEALGTHLGINSLAMAVGCGVGTIFGGWCFDAVRNPHIPWLLFAAIGAAASAGFLLLDSKLITGNQDICKKEREER